MEHLDQDHPLARASEADGPLGSVARSALSYFAQEVQNYLVWARLGPGRILLDHCSQALHTYFVEVGLHSQDLARDLVVVLDILVEEVLWVACLSGSPLKVVHNPQAEDLFSGYP